MTLFRKDKIDRTSIKESIDNLPSGICFADKNGLLVLCNRQMYRLSHTLLGKDLQYISELQDAMTGSQKVVEIVSADTNVFRFPSGEVWKFSESHITDADGNGYTQVQAVNVTALYEKEKELEQQNRRLAEVNARAKKLYTELDQIVREEENFAVKTRVHDEMGELLGFTRNLMAKQVIPPDSLKSIAKRWEKITETLGVSTDDSEDGLDSDKMLTQLTEGIAGIGVALHIKGEFPKKGCAAHLLASAVRECAVNTVRHAKGNEMTMELTRTDAVLTAIITNNGKIPEGEITEGGGLSALRRRIESAGGIMRVLSTPVFKLEIILPGKEEAV